MTIKGTTPQNVVVDEAFDAGLPKRGALPYAGTSGRGGSSSSASARAAEDADGTTSERQRMIIALVGESGEMGMTSAEISQRLGYHHGQASGALSSLHKEGHLARLAGRGRGRYSVYVTPSHVAGRATEAQGFKNRTGETVPTPTVQRAPLVLSETEADLIRRLRENVAQRHDSAIVSLRTPSAKMLLGVIDRALNAEAGK